MTFLVLCQYVRIKKAQNFFCASPCLLLDYSANLIIAFTKERAPWFTSEML